MYYDETNPDPSMLTDLSDKVEDEGISSLNEGYDPSEWYGEFLGAYYLEIKEYPKRYAEILSGADGLVRSLQGLSKRRD